MTTALVPIRLKRNIMPGAMIPSRSRSAILTLLADPRD